MWSLPASQRTLLRPAGESKTGKSPETPSIVSRTCKPKPAGHALGKLVGNPLARAPFRRLPIRAPRQAVLRTSSWLAPSLTTNRPCDLPVEKTRDASNRCLPPIRTTCTRTSRVPGSLSQLSLRGFPTETKAPCGVNRGTGRFTTSEDRFGGPSCNAALELYCLTAWRHERGRFLPTALMAIEPLTPLSRPPSFHPHASHHLRGCCNLAVRPSFEGVGTGRRMRRPPRPPLTPARES
jgi:hypothetical protein